MMKGKVSPKKRPQIKVEGENNNEEIRRKSARLATRQSRAAAYSQKSALATIAAGMQSVLDLDELLLNHYCIY